MVDGRADTIICGFFFHGFGHQNAASVNIILHAFQYHRKYLASNTNLRRMPNAARLLEQNGLFFKYMHFVVVVVVV